MPDNSPPTFQALVLRLREYWAEQGCALLESYDMPMGAATFHPATFLRALGPQPWHAAFVQPCRRPTDGRYGENPNRAQQYFQFQVLMKPVPDDFQQRYLGSLTALGLELDVHDVRFVEDDWASPTLGAWGLGWEVWLNGMEISQFTYFQQVGGIECDPVSLELTYGLERLAMYIQGVENVFDLDWNGDMTYGDVYLRKLLIHGARSVLRWADRKPDKRSQWVTRLKTRRGQNIAAVALANKTVRTAWVLMTREEEYRTALV